MLISVLGAALALSACAPGEPVGPDPSDVSALREAIEATRLVSAEVDLVVRVVLDGEPASDIHATGRIADGGSRHHLQVVGPASFGLPSDDDRPLEMLLVDGVVFQRGPVVDQLFGDIGDRWLDSGLDLASSVSSGLIGAGGLEVLDLLDDLDRVERTSGASFAGTLTEVRVGGRRVASVAAADFTASIVDGVIGQLSVSVRSANGVELQVEFRLSHIGAVAPIEAPGPSEIHRP